MMNVNKPLNITITFDGEGFIAQFKETNCVIDRAMTTSFLARMLKAEIERFYQRADVSREPTIPVTRVSVIDPDSKLPVEVEIRKCVESGAMVGIDGSYLEQDVNEVRNPYNPGLLDIPGNE